MVWVSKRHKVVTDREDAPGPETATRWLTCAQARGLQIPDSGRSGFIRYPDHSRAGTPRRRSDQMHLGPGGLRRSQLLTFMADRERTARGANRLTLFAQVAKYELLKQDNPSALVYIHLIIHTTIRMKQPGASTRVMPRSTPSSPSQSPRRWLHLRTAN